MSLRVVGGPEVLAAYIQSARTPIDKIRAAIAWASETLGVRLLPGDYGVIPGPGGTWEVDRRRRPMGISPLGAVVLCYATENSKDMPDPAADVLGVPVAWVSGFEDGFDREMTGHWLGSVNRRRYLEGYETGMLLRFEFTRQCVRCGSRHFCVDRCPLCEERRAPNEGIEPLPSPEDT